MQTIQVTAAAGVTIETGRVLKLTPAQADGRALTPVDKRKGVYRVDAPATFKRGEEFGIEGDLPKGFAELVETAAEAKARADAAAAAASKAEAAILSRVADAVQAEQDRLFALTPEAFAAEKAAAAEAAARG